ncbi:hypothetical protein L1787_19160 [Acuticoccus sp. M5D2P5]|uniref:hypothetical protein n=1 Tax=Acuticoccus kalidii TaxID=2910977 RepID=UPI001F1D94A3|nr:hypothetical protein [Acuticoccus kalidii]MCF3935514.1 hypothetical protein [Acuticoccus kalidii]
MTRIDGWRGAKALAVAAMLAATPMAAPPAAAQASNLAEPLGCDEGALGPGGLYTNTDLQEGALMSVDLAFQCGGTLADDRFVPTGYRVRITRACGNADACELPITMATAANANGRLFSANIVDEEGTHAFRFRVNRGDALVVTEITRFEDGRQRERQQYTLTKQ